MDKCSAMCLTECSGENEVISVPWVLCMFRLWLLCNLLKWWVIYNITISTAVIEGSDCLCHFSVRYFAMINISQQRFFLNLSWETKEWNKHSKSLFNTYKSEFQQVHVYWSDSKGESFGLNLWQEWLPREMSEQWNKFKTQVHLEMSPSSLFLATRYWCILWSSAYTTTRLTELHFCKTAVGNNEFTFVLMSVCRMYEYETRKVLMPLTKCHYTV